MAKIFISYRRDDTQGEARHLAESLEKHFGKGKVFLDVESIKPGLDFRQVLQGRVMRSDCLLALIGPNWLDIEDRATKKRRLDNPDDLVRKEIGDALKRKIPVTPVLVKDVAMPEKEQLPDELKKLADLQNFKLRHDRWNDDVRELANRLRLGAFRVSVMGKLSTARKTLGIAAALVFLSVVGQSVVGQYWAGQRADRAERQAKELEQRAEKAEQQAKESEQQVEHLRAEVAKDQEIIIGLKKAELADVVEGDFVRYQNNEVLMTSNDGGANLLALYGLKKGTVNTEIATKWMANHDNKLTCRRVGLSGSSNSPPYKYRCLAANTFDLAEALLLNGGAEALGDAPQSYHEAHDQFVARQKIRNHSH